MSICLGGDQTGRGYRLAIAAAVTLQPTVPAVAPRHVTITARDRQAPLVSCLGLPRQSTATDGLSFAGRRVRRLRQAGLYEQGVGAGGPQRHLPCDDVGWFYCLVPPLGPAARRGTLTLAQAAPTRRVLIPPSARVPGQVPVSGHRSPQGGSRAAHRRGAPAPAGSLGRRRRRHRLRGRHPAGKGPRHPGPPRGLPRHRRQGGRCADRPHPAAPRRPAPGRVSCSCAALRRASQPCRGTRRGVPAGQARMSAGTPSPAGWSTPGAGLPPRNGRMPSRRSSTRGLPVDPRTPDYAGAKMGYWPSYSSIPAGLPGRVPALASRRAACPRRVHRVRLPVLLRPGTPPARRLAAVAGGQGRAPRAGRGRSSACCASTGRTARSVVTPATCSASCPWAAAPGGTCPRRQNSRTSWELPFELRLGLGQLAADGRPVPAAWAWPGCGLHPAAWLRTPANAVPRRSSTSCSPAATGSASATA